MVRPAISRSGSTKLKKKASSSRLSFGVTDPAGDSSEQPITPKKSSTLSQRATENSALRSSLSSRKLPTRSFGPEVEGTSYSKEYLEELQSSTPNTPQNIASLRIHDDDADTSTGAAGNGGDAMDLDPSELEGAVVVPQSDLSMSAFSTTGGHIPSAVEIREKKERRARLAAEGGAYNDEDENDDDYISLAPKKKKDDTRLIAEDEDLGEGYDEFVEDARLELGKKGEREAARRHRREMAELIDAAEGGDGDDGPSDADSDAERTAAYEAAQTRAAMGGHHHHITTGKESGAAGTTGLVIPRMRALPELGESLARMRSLVQGVEEQAAAKRRRIEALEKERQEIIAREAEVQEVLNQAGVKYQAAMGGGSGAVDPLRLAAESPLRAAAGPGTGAIPPAQRGLESFGTPSRRQEYDDDEEMAG